jgi:hypothetical protein
MCIKYERENYVIVHATTMNRHKWANYDIMSRESACIGRIREYTRDGGNILVESELPVFKERIARSFRSSGENYIILDDWNKVIDFLDSCFTE